MPQVSQQELIAGVKQGKVISFPTDTVPALAALPESASLIFATKQRPPDKPLILMGSSSDAIWKYVKGTPQEFEIWEKVVKQYWPGQLTLVLPASEWVPKAMNPLEPTTIGVRIPNSIIAQNILKQTGCLATTSANLSGEPPIETLSEIAANFPDVLVLNEEVLKNQKKYGSGLPSTVAKWTDTDWKILRQGSIKLTENK
ncbi:putative YrdC-like RNA-binding protein [Crocosphaera subtropica ATCC 51142]|uniref:L-threonylcarbamoyladenylate synthase n=1 Tax=Crocosphaera subtropica (strain ATCC 51142 / BH68) TaxID=43989 RepID=B1WRW0_CROS5|nr:L-threonylcarbamoyladenylate synthase [Crocosphaera subtropica]ACB53551.1 putative YrdC-like RNA-binding protein [Crocosphaera subtropica ATCC 51142]